MDALKKYSFGKIKKMTDFIGFGNLLLLVMASIFVGYVNKITGERFTQNQIQKNRYKKMLDISIDGIVIIKEKTIDYINDKFV